MTAIPDETHIPESGDETGGPRSDETASASAGDAVSIEGHPDIVEVRSGDRTWRLVGTAHVSRESADLVREVIERFRPDRVCVELDPQRFETLSKRKRWDNLDLRQVIRDRKLPALIVNLLLSSYQKKLGGKLGIAPGTELLEATRVAERLEIPHELCDRDIRVTMLRAWRSMSFWQQCKILGGLVAGVAGDQELSEEDLRELRRQDVLSEMMNELAEFMPELKRSLIDERDAYMAERIRRAEGRDIVAVVGAGHLEGIRRALEEGGGDAPAADLGALDRIPPASSAWKWVGWSIPAVVVGLIATIAVNQGFDAASDSMKIWVLVNGIPAALGALIAWAHPATIAAAFLGAPITSLTPVIGAGYVTAFVQAWMRPPLVRDFHTLSEDALKVPRWWRNRLLKVALAFVLPTIGSLIGTVLGLGTILSRLG